MSSCRNSTRKDEQRWPALSKAETITSFATCSGRAVESTIIAFSPPVSAISAGIGPSRAARARLMRAAVSVEPVKATPDSRGSANMIFPMRAPSPGRRCSTSPGTPASCSSRTAAAATSGVCSAGLASTLLPAASAPATWPVKIESGKFHGAMQANTPRPAGQENFVLPSRREAPPRLQNGRAPPPRNSAGNRRLSRSSPRALAIVRPDSRTTNAISKARCCSNRSAARSRIAARAAPPSRSHPSCAVAA